MPASPAAPPVRQEVFGLLEDVRVAVHRVADVDHSGILGHVEAGQSGILQLHTCTLFRSVKNHLLTSCFSTPTKMVPPNGERQIHTCCFLCFPFSIFLYRVRLGDKLIKSYCLLAPALVAIEWCCVSIQVRASVSQGDISIKKSTLTIECVKLITYNSR